MYGFELFVQIEEFRNTAVLSQIIPRRRWLLTRFVLLSNGVMDLSVKYTPCVFAPTHLHTATFGAL